MLGVEELDADLIVVSPDELRVAGDFVAAE